MGEISAFSGIRMPSTQASTGSSLSKYWRALRNALRKLGGDGMLGYTIYAMLFVGFFNSSSNSMQFGKQVLIAIQADRISKDPKETINRDLIRFIAVAVMSIISLLQFFSPRAGRGLNRGAAVIKIMFLLLLIGFGGWAAAAEGSTESWSTYYTKSSEDCAEDDNWKQKCVQNGSADAKNNWPKALLLVFFSFEGWENATFVSTRLQRLIKSCLMHN